MFLLDTDDCFVEGYGREHRVIHLGPAISAVRVIDLPREGTYRREDDLQSVERERQDRRLGNSGKRSCLGGEADPTQQVLKPRMGTKPIPFVVEQKGHVDIPLVEGASEPL